LTVVNRDEFINIDNADFDEDEVFQMTWDRRSSPGGDHEVASALAQGLV
jgi:hypothetical protein